MSEATGFETVDRKVAKNSFTPLQGWDDIRKVFELLRADEDGALLVKGLADVTIGEISVDNVELIDSTGKKLLFTESGEIKAYASDGSLVTLGTTTDADTANTVIGILKALKGKDFATQTTLATLATETTLDSLKTALEAIKDTDGIKKIVDKVDTKIADGDNVALGTTTDADTVTTVIGLLKKLQSILEAGIDVTESSPLTTIGTTIGDGDDEALGSTSDTDSDNTVIGRLQKLITDLGTLADSKKLSDIITAIDYESGISATGAIGTLTATTTASAAIAGGTALANRKGLEILNNSANVVYWGYTDSVTTATGMPINPGISKTFEFKPSVATAIYVIAASDSQLYIHEWK